MTSTNKELLERIAELEKEKADLKANRRVVSVKAKETGTVAVYGIRARFPVSYYPAEWDVIFAQRDKILAACTADQRKVAEDNRKAKQAG